MPLIEVNSYTGECKRGRAHGEGKVETSKGTYEGNFKKGQPDGYGIWKYEDGRRYEGEWDSGLKDGEGTMYYPSDSVLIGYWKNDYYVSRYEKPYEMNSTSFSNNSRVKVMKTGESTNKIEIIFTRGGTLNTSDLSRVQIQNSTGILNNINGRYYIESVEYPIEGRIDFSALNKLRTTQLHETYNFKFYEKGHWIVTFSY